MKESLQTYTDLLIKWGNVHNLVGKTTPSEIAKNIEDSLYPTRFLKPFSNALDIGSGAGYPAIPLAIYYPNAQFTLVEPREKRASFLKIVALELGLSNVTVIAKKVQDIEPMPFDLITSRAVGELEFVRQISSHLIAKEGYYLLYKGENLINELASLTHHEIVTNGKINYIYFKGNQWEC